MIKITAIILTYNEESNLHDCLESLKGVADEIFLVDSGSTDNTIKIASEYNCKIFSHPFINYSDHETGL